MTKTSFIFLLSFALLSKPCLADEGMWLPNLIKAYNYNDMKSKGLMISAEDLYSANKASIKDAVAHFNGGCTAEIISKKGLLVTNHHCGYSFIAGHSTTSKDYLTDGFWAMNLDEELPNANLYVDFIVKIEDVTEKIIPTGSESETIIVKNINTVGKELIKGSHYLASIKPFNYGTKYFAFIIERFNDIRLVGAPPSSIGKFGYDTDNWLWPRHTGDFSIFRIYADANNKPAYFSPSNKPYQPKYSLPISLEGIKDGDFAMVYGFPGATDQHLTSYAVEQKLKIVNPTRISMREASLRVINKTMAESDEKKLHLSPHQSSISNYWKKFKGESFGLERENAIEEKQKIENEFTELINKSEKLKAKFGNILPNLQNLYAQMDDLEQVYNAHIEYFFSGFGSFKPAYINAIINYYNSEKEEESFLLELENQLNSQRYYPQFYEYNQSMILEMTKALLQNIKPTHYPKILLDEHINVHNFDDWFKLNHSISIYSDSNTIKQLKKENFKKRKKRLGKDKLFLMAKDIHEVFNSMLEDYRQKTLLIDDLMKQYVQAIEEVFPNKTKWYDANSTLRISYGNIEGSSPVDGMKYIHYTTTDGILQKYKPGDREFDAPEKLIELIKKKDFGSYAQDSTMIVCFTSNNHTTGGNSGSPVLNGKGHLIGINFDRSWESTMSDVMYSEEICRNITLDVRYMLFIIDKYADAKYLINEMELIEKEDPLALKRKVLKREIEILTSIIGGAPKQADLYFKRAKAYYELGELRESLKDYEKAVELDPKPAHIKQRDFIKNILQQIESIKE